MTAAATAHPPLLFRLAGLAGWRRGLLGFALGVAATSALPPFGVVPMVWVAFSGLALQLSRAGSHRRAFWDGWWFGFGFFTTSLYWMSEAMLIDPAFAWMIPFSLFGFPVFLGLFTGTATLIATALPGGGTALGRPVALAVTWTAAEWLRGHLLTGFPWNLIGYVWTASDIAMQPGALIGIYGMSVLTVWLAALPASLLGPRRPALAALALGGALMLGFALYGSWRLPAAPAATVPGLKFRLVQAAIAQQLKWLPEQREAIFDRHLQLSALPGEGITHIIWPEAAVPFALADDGPRRGLAGHLAPENGLLLTGTVRRETDRSKPFRVWNSLIAIDHDGEVVGVYDKYHLVPFGEYFPLRGVVEGLGLTNLMPGPIDFSPGPGPALMTPPGLPPFLPLICYEVIFPDRLLPHGPRPAWMLTVTNDAWFGLSSGPHQHFAMARMRSVEQGLPLVRAANSGISAIIDPYGRIVARLGLGQSGVIDGPLPAALEPTLYARCGDLPALAIWVVALLFTCLKGRVR